MARGAEGEGVGEEGLEPRLAVAQLLLRQRPDRLLRRQPRLRLPPARPAARQRPPQLGAAQGGGETPPRRSRSWASSMKLWKVRVNCQGSSTPGTEQTK